MHFSLVNQDHYGSGLNINYEDETSGRLTSVGSLCGLDAEHKPWLHVNIRYSITADADALLEQMTEVCRKHGFSLRLLLHRRPNHFPLEHPVVKRLTDVYNQLSGDHAEPFVMGGGTYARMLPRAFAYGMGLPGDRNDHPMFREGHGGVHEPDEALKMESLVRAAVIFGAGILSLEDIEL